MKCQKCGINEVNFHYSTNVNGCVTETNLCSQCAAQSGYDIGKLFNTKHDSDLESLFSAMFPVRGGIRGFMPMSIPGIRANAFLPISIQPAGNKIMHNDGCNCGYETGVKRDVNVEVDEEMKIRRELNAQMRAAVENEEFEKAAILRDKIKALETTGAQRAVNAQETLNTQASGGHEKCDSEKTSQDSQAAQ